MNLPRNNSFKAIESFFKENLKSLYPPEEIKAIFYLLMEDLLGITKTQFILEPSLQKFTESDINRINDALALLKKQHPIQYVLGKAHFYDLLLNVNSHVLIPRPETEELVDWIIKTCPPNFDGTILDIGTGSGAIAIALKSKLINAKIFGIDVSTEALEVAKQNAVSLNLNVDFINFNVLTNKYLPPQIKPDIIVSNPPYVLTKEKVLMAPHVLNHEPHLALFVDNEEPLVFYKQITKLALDALPKNGLLFFEINEAYGRETCLYLENNGFNRVLLKKDLNGKDRMVKAVKDL